MTVVVLTALGLEYDAVRAHLTDFRLHSDIHGTRYEVGRLRGGQCRVALVLIGEGNLAAAALTGQAIEDFAPRAVLLVGVAGGLKADAALGDVVVATRIHAYHSGREETAGFRPRPKSWPVPHAIEQIARDVARAGVWTDRVAGDPATPTVHFKPLISGEVVLDSRTSPLAKFIAAHYSDAIAVDMESAGVAEAAHRKDFHRVITVRGISDAADGAKHRTDTAGWQPKAAAHAAAFAIALAEGIDRQPSRATPAPRRTHSALARTLFAIAVLLSVLVLGAASEAPAPGSSIPGWARIAGGDNIAFGDYQAIDLETGAVGDIDEIATAKPGMDIALTQRALRLSAVRLPALVALLDGPGPHDPNRCTALRADKFIDTIGNTHELLAGQDLCVATDRGNAAILTIDEPPDNIHPVMTFHYTLWKRSSPRATTPPETPSPRPVVSATHTPSVVNPVSGWVRIGGGDNVAFGDYQAIDLETGAVGDIDEIATAKPGMDVALTERATRLSAVRLPALVALLDNPGAHDPNRCTALRPDKFTGTIGNTHELLAGQDLCVATDQGHAAILTIDKPPDNIQPIMTFHYTLWKRP